MRRIASSVIFVSIIIFVKTAYGFNLDKIKADFLSGDYKTAISEGEKILAKVGNEKDLDELYYFLGLSYLKDGNYLRASDIFEIILTEFSDSAFAQAAKLGLGDTYFLNGDYDHAKRYYEALIKEAPRTKLKADIYYRLSQVGLKSGDSETARKYLGEPDADIYYTVQVGSFLEHKNAKGLMQKLTAKNYPAYIEEARSEDKIIYRVRVGRFNLRQEAQGMANKLSQEGYPTKISP